MSHPSRSEVYVWDRFVRTFHWTLVLAFAVAYFTEDELLGVHAWAGYLAGVLIVLRVLWGLVGSRHARFVDFIYRPRKVLGYLRDLSRLRAERYLGHSPAGGAMVIALICCIAATAASGLVVYGAEEGMGPLAPLFAGQHGKSLLVDALGALHEVIANLTFVLVLAHIAGVALASFAHGENLVRAMLTGYKRG